MLVDSVNASFTEVPREPTWAAQVDLPSGSLINGLTRQSK